MNSATSRNKRSGWWKYAALLLVGIVAVLLNVAPAFSQGSSGRILGTVTDSSGGVVAGATVTVLDVDRGTSRVLTTDDAGAYNAPNLTPGNYTVRGEAKGFKRIERQNVVVEVSHEYRIDLTLQPGEQTQTVTVTEAVPLVETTNATMGGTLENADIIDLPLNGRDYQNLLALRPGVQLYPGGGPWTQSGNNTRPDTSVWMIEGVINVNPFDARPIVNTPSPFTDGATILPVDAIQEFNVMENPKAEWGWKTGAIVNVGIRSGTNSLHGTGYAFGRYQGWDARNYFNIVPSPDGTSCALGPTVFCKQTPIELKQFGGTGGGAIKKDKLFYFGGYEGLRDQIQVPFGIPMPSVQAITGGDPANSMVDAINAVHLSTASLSTVSLKLLCPNAVGYNFATPFAGPCSGGFTPDVGPNHFFLSAFPIINRSDNGVGKIDWHANDKNQITGTMVIGFYDAVGEDRPFSNALFEDVSPIRAWTNVDSWVYTPSSNVVNEMRFGYNRWSFAFNNVDINRLADGNGYPINTGVTVPGGMPTIEVQPFLAGGADLLGTNDNRPQNSTPNPYYNFLDSISWLRGKHALKFGGEFSHIEADAATFNEGRGKIFFNGGAAFSGSTALEDFFAGQPSSALLEVGDPRRAATWMVAAGYIQDDIRVNPKLILNVGMRYEYFTPMHMKNDAWASFEPNQGLVQQGAPGLPTLWSGDHTGFEPRLGFAYDLTGKGTTVIRAGGSLLRETWPLNTFLNPQGLQNDPAANPAAVGTAAILQCAGSGIACPATPGGTNALGVANLGPGALNWNAAPGTAGVFGSGASALSCGDGIANAGEPSGFDASPCDVAGINKNLFTPFVVTYTLSVQHQIGTNLSVEVAYVGNRGYQLLNFRDINQPLPGAAYCFPNNPSLRTAAQNADACKGVGAAGLPVGSGTVQAIQEARPFFAKYPYLGFINQISNASYSRYNSVQVSITKRMSHGLSFVTGYTYGHGLDNGSLNRFGGLPQDSTNPNAEYASSDFDVRHRLTVTATYNIPGIKGYGQLLEGWQLNGIFSYATPMPWNAFDKGNDFSGVGDKADRWNIFGNPLDFPSGKISVPQCNAGAGLPFDAGSTVVAGVLTPDVTCGTFSVYGFAPSSASFTSTAIAGCLAHSAGGGAAGSTLQSGGCYISPDGNSYIVPPTLGSFGNMGRNIFRDSGFKNIDLSIFKNFKFKERFGIQARWEVFNVVNHPIIANPAGGPSWLNSGNFLQAGGLGASLATPDVGYGNPLIGSGSSRVMQIGLKITY